MNDLQIEFALALAKYKSFSLTEQNIYVSRSVIRKQITALEKELGVLLFIRSKQSVTLTDEGKIIIEALKITKNINAQAIERAKQLTLNEDAVLNIGYLQFMCDFKWLNMSLEKMKDKQSALLFRYICHSPAQLNASLNDGSADVIITVESEIEEHPDIRYIDFDEYERGVIVSSKHPAAQEERLDLSKLKNERIFMFSPEGYQGISKYIKIVRNIFGVSSADLKILPNVGSMFANIEAGLGVGVFAATPAIYGNAAIRCFPIDGLKQKTVLVWRKTNNKKVLREFIKVI